MIIDNLDQFNPKQFYKLLGLYIQEKRKSFDISTEGLAKMTGIISATDLALVESGQKNISDKELDQIAYTLALDTSEIINIARITQVQEMMEFAREINELYP